MAQILATERLYLKPLKLSDETWIKEIYEDEKVTSGFDHAAFTGKELEAKKNQLLQSWAPNGFSHF